MPNYKRYKSSITNNTRVFSIMNGLAPHSYSQRGNSRATKKLVIPADPKEGLEYMEKHDILSKNPACSGGVGRVNHTYCTSKDGLFMSVASNNFLYNHIYKNNDIYTHHLQCTGMYEGKPGVTVGKIIDQGFDSSGNPVITENMFMCDVSANLPDECTTDLSNVLAFYLYSNNKNLFESNITNLCTSTHATAPSYWEIQLDNCISSGSQADFCSQQKSDPNTIVVDDASGFIGILALVSIHEKLKPITFKQIELSGEWSIPEINMNIYYPTRSPDKNKPFFHVLPGAKITNNANITFMDSDLNTNLFHIEGEFTNNGTIKYNSQIINLVPSNSITFFNVENDQAAFTNNGVIELPGISYTYSKIIFVNVINGANFYNNSSGKISTSMNIYNDESQVRIFNIINKSSFENDGQIMIPTIGNSSSMNKNIFYMEASTLINSGDISINSIDNYGTGFNLIYATFTNKNGNIAIGDISNNSLGFDIVDSVVNNIKEGVYSGSIKINKIIGDSYGFKISDNVILNNNQYFTISDIENNSYGLFSNNSDISNADYIEFDTINGNSFGLMLQDSSVSNVSNGFITFGEITRSEGIYFNKSSLINYGVISALNIATSSIMMKFISSSFHNYNINQIMKDISGNSKGISSESSSLYNSSNGVITMPNIENSSSGFYFEKSSLLNNDGDITTGDIENQSNGVVIVNDSSLNNNGNIEFGSVSNNGNGFSIQENSSFNHNEGAITIGNIENQSNGILISDSLFFNIGDINMGDISVSVGISLYKSHFNNQYISENKFGNISLGNISYGYGISADNSTLNNTSNISMNKIVQGSGLECIQTLFYHVNKDITIGDIATGIGLHFTESHEVVIKGEIIMNNLNVSDGFLLDNSDLSFSNSSVISINTLDNGSNGFNLKNSGLTTSDFTISISNINSSYGFSLEQSTLTNNGDTTITMNKITNGTGFHITNDSTLTNNADINLTTVEGDAENIAYGLHRDDTSSIVNNKSILFTDIKNKAVGVFADIPSILPHEIMGGYGKIDVSNIDYQDQSNPYTYAFGKRGIALTRALMDNAVEFTKNEVNSSSNYCPSSHPYAYMEFENQQYNISENEISNDLNGTLKSKCCSVQPSVSGISHKWSGLNRNSINYIGTDAANLSAVRRLATNYIECGGVDHAAAAWNGWTANGAFSFRHVCPEGASYDPGIVDNTLQSMPGIPQAHIFSTKTMYSQQIVECPDVLCRKKFFSFGYGWRDLEYRDAWDELKGGLGLSEKLITNEKVYYLSPVEGTPYARSKDPHTTWLTQDIIAGADVQCANECNNHTDCTSYSLIPKDIDGGTSESTIQYYCLGRSDGYTDYKGVQGWGGIESSGQQGKSLPDNWNASDSSRGTNYFTMNFHYAQWCDSIEYTFWRPASAAPAPLVGFVKKPPQVAPIINFNGSVNIAGGRGDENQDAAIWQYNALKKSPDGIEKWCDKYSSDADFIPFSDMGDGYDAKTREQYCIGNVIFGAIGGCWDPDPDFGGCYKPTNRNDGGVLSLEKMPAEIVPNTGKAEVDSKSEQGTDPKNWPSPFRSEWLMNTKHEITPITTPDVRPDITDIVKKTTPL